MATPKKTSSSKRKPAKSTATASKASDTVVADDSIKATDTVSAKTDDTIAATSQDTVAAKGDDTVAAVGKTSATVKQTTAMPKTPKPDTKPEPAKSDPVKSEPIKASAPGKAASEPVKEKPVPAVVASAPPPAEQRGTFLPMVLGGVVAAAIGFFAAQYGLFADKGEDPAIALRSDLTAQQERITALEGVEAPTFDLSPLETQLADLDTRVKALEDRPVVVPSEGVDVDAIASAAAATYARELEGLRASVENQRGEIQDLLTDAKNAEQATTDAATRASAQTALANIVSALDAGQPFAQPLADLKALDIGEIDPALDAVATDGAATLSMLQAQFPQQAREALAVARSSNQDEGQQGVGNFLKRSLGARSVAPREGNDPDAILSRAEAALDSGDLTTALTELDTLPEDAQAAIADWRAAADAHLDARKAADALAQRLTAD